MEESLDDEVLGLGFIYSMSLKVIEMVLVDSGNCGSVGGFDLICIYFQHGDGFCSGFW